jgi:pyruvate,orthophosphate dikinase
VGEFVFHFGGDAQSVDPRAQDKTVVGGKGANLAQMAAIGLPVPPGLPSAPKSAPIMPGATA